MFASLPDQPERSPNLYVDWNWWGHSKSKDGSNLEHIYNAVCNRQALRVSFPLWNRMEFEQEIEPYGVVAKAGEWYLVYMNAGRCRMRRISDLRNITFTGRTFIRPEDFDLESTWKRLCLEEEDNYFLYTVEVRFSPELIPYLHEPTWGIPFRIKEISPNEDLQGWRRCTLFYENLFSARSHLLGWGNAVEVIKPEALRASMQDFAKQINSVYKK